MTPQRGTELPSFSSVYPVNPTWSWPSDDRGSTTKLPEQSLLSTETPCLPGAVIPIPPSHIVTDGRIDCYEPVEGNKRYVEGIGRLINIFNQNIIIDETPPTLSTLPSLDNGDNARVDRPPRTARHCSRCRTKSATRWTFSRTSRRFLCQACANKRAHRRRKERGRPARSSASLPSLDSRSKTAYTGGSPRTSVFSAAGEEKTLSRRDDMLFGYVIFKGMFLHNRMPRVEKWLQD